jgi:Dolichyl-phosphate-mannose-protein mannosyltransferase
MLAIRRLGGMEFIWLVVVAALAARGWYLNALADGGRSGGPLEVQGVPLETRAMSASLSEQHSFSARAPFALGEEQTAHVSPGYPYVLSWLDRAPFSLDTRDRTIRWLQCIVGSFTVLLYYLFAHRAFGSTFVASFAGLLCACHPYWVVNTAELNDGVLTTFLLGLAIWLGARSVQDAGLVSGFLFGITLAALALTRAAYLPFVFVALLWFVGRCRVVRRGWLCALLATLGLLNGLLPWTFRNYRLVGEVVPVVSSAPYHFWIGNNPKATGGPLDEKIQMAALAESRGGTAQELERTIGELPQKARYDRLAADAWSEIQRHPAETARRRIMAGLGFFFGFNWLENGRGWVAESSSGAETAGPDLSMALAVLNGACLFMIAFGLLGWRWSSTWGYQAMPMSLVLLWIPLPYILGHADALVGPRLPIDGVILCYAAYGVACLLAPYRSGLLRRADS